MQEIKNKIVYLANVRLPTEKAHGIQIAKMCEEFSNQGMSVELVVPDRGNQIKEDFFDYYKINKNFLIKKLPCFDLISYASWLGPFAYWVEALSFAWSIKKYYAKSEAIFYTRELSNVAFVSNSEKIIFEVHNLPNRKISFFQRWLKKADKLVAITHGLKNALVKMNFPEDRILVASDAVDFKTFNDVLLTQEESRTKYSLPLKSKIILYTGHLYAWKGVDTMFEAAMLLPEYFFVFVGGTEEKIAEFRKKTEDVSAKNIIIAGHYPNGELPFFLRASDLLVLPNSAKTAISALYTSPLKLFEYMTSKKPIIASELPSLKEILDKKTAFFFKPDDPASLAEGIKKVFSELELAKRVAENAYLKVQDYTWEKRVQKISNFITN